MRWCLYRIKHIPSGKLYTGLTGSDLAVRMHMHFASMNDGTPMHTLMKEEGWSAFEIFEIKRFQDKREALVAEKDEIRNRPTYHPFGFNFPQGIPPKWQAMIKARTAIDDMIGERHLANTPVPFPTFEPEQAASLAPSDDAADQA